MIISQTNRNGFSPPQTSDVSMPHRPVVQNASTAAAGLVETPAKAVQGAVSIPSHEQVKQAVEHLNNLVQTMTSDLRFSVDADTGMRVVKVVDIKTNDVIQQIPSKEVVAIAKALDTLQGLLIRQKA